jgi:hypothetical protein
MDLQEVVREVSSSCSPDNNFGIISSELVPVLQSYLEFPK